MLVAFFIVLLVNHGSFGGSRALQNQERTSLMSEKQFNQARGFYKQSCARCHGADGRGETTKGQILGATDLTKAEWQERVDDTRLINSITHGRGEMPSFEKKFTSNQIKLLAAYVRTLKTKTK